MRHKTPWLVTAATALFFMTAGGWSVPGNGFSLPGLRTAAAQSTASIEGFRSARFGMTENKVYKALKKDFGIAKDAVTRTQNSIEKTISLVITINDIIPDSGPAIVAYIFGYESKKLIQINVVWSGDEKNPASAENLVATGNILRNYFVAQGFPADGLLTNQRLTNGSIVMFRGLDSKGRATVLQLNIEKGVVSEGGTTSDAKVTSLNLSYILDPVAPDIFKINAGEF